MTQETKVTHTLGPWHVAEVNTTSPERYNIVARAGDGRDYTIAQCPQWPLHADEAEANARLIAAAPALLEALGVLVSATNELCASADEYRMSVGDVDGLRSIGAAVDREIGQANEALTRARAAIAATRAGGSGAVGGEKE